MVAAQSKQRPELPDSLLAKLRSDPLRAPEHLALAAAERHAPAAERWLAERQSFYAANPGSLAQMAKKRHATWARFGGAATGLGGFLTVLPDLAALAWIQSRMVFFIAAAYGRDPHDPARPAELLVLQGVYEDVATARNALDGVGKTVAEAYLSSRISRDQALLGRLVMMVGRRAGSRFAGRLIPGVAIAFNAVGNERDTRKLADQAIRFYSG